MRKLLLALGVLMCFPAYALIELAPGETGNETVTVLARCSASPPCEVCEECEVCTNNCPPIKPGKSHGAMHTAYTATQYAQCKNCHTGNDPDGAIPAEWPGSLCPSQGPEFANPELLSKLGLPALTMYGDTFTLSDGTTFLDSWTNQPVVVGGQMGGYAPGETPLCVHCHNHYGRSPEQVGWRSQTVHYGCLDCHARVDSTSLKPGIKNLVGDDD